MKTTVSFLIFLFFFLNGNAQINITTGSPTFVYNGTSVSRPAHTFTWKDATDTTRKAVMVDQSAAGCGYLAQFTYKVAGVDRVCQGTGSNGRETYGDGFVQNHTGNGGDSEATSTTGTTTMPLQGSHHAIVQYNMPTYTISDPNNGGGNVPTAIQWFFATGRDYPIYAISQDARQRNGNIAGDSRSPYGDMHYDGSNPANGPWGGDLIGGVSMGDSKKWVSVVNGTTNESTLLTTNSGYNYSEANTIPYVSEWTKNVDAEQGHVQTLPISIRDAGRRDPGAALITTHLNGPMIGDEEWMYQTVAYGILSNTGGVTKRLTWGTNFGAIGGFDDWWLAPGTTIKEFTKHSDGLRTTGDAGMFLGYSVFDVFGTHTGGYKGGSVGKMVTQMENMQTAILTTSIGTVVTSGPAGVQGAGAGFSTVPTTVYTPAGYNAIYATWEINAAANLATTTLTPATGKPIENPIFVINNYNLSTINQIKIDGNLGTPNTDYFASLDTANQKLWITVNKTASVALQLELTGTLSIAENDNKKMLVSIYPNPSNGVFAIETNHSINSIKAFDVLGKQIPVKTTSNKQFLIEKSGIYFLKVELENGAVLNKKVIVE